MSSNLTPFFASRLWLTRIRTERTIYTFILVNADPKWDLAEGGRLCDIIPTLLGLMGLEQPAEMTGRCLLVEKK